MTESQTQTKSWLLVILRTGMVLAAANLFASLLASGRFHWRIGPFSFPAEHPFKPLLVLNGVFLLNILFGGRRDRSGECGLETGWLARCGSAAFALFLVAFTIALYVPALQVNIAHHDWTHRHIGALLTSPAAVAHLFINPQIDGMYRPLAFLSFWLDYRVFGDSLWGYHLQSIALHVLNTMLVVVLGAHLGMRLAVSRGAALLFAASSIHFEAVLWPAARFDPLATLFCLLSLLCFIRHWKAPGYAAGYAAASLSCFVLGILNKETAYSLVLLIPALVMTRRLWGLPPVALRKALLFAAALSTCAAIPIGIRIRLFGSLGGYSYHTGQPAVPAGFFKMSYLLVERSLALTPFGINMNRATLASMAILGAYALLLAALVFQYRSRTDRRMWALTAFTLLSAVPVLTVIGWVQPSLQHSRHLYWPSVWMSLLLAMALHRTIAPGRAILILLAIQCAGLSYNIWVYRDSLDQIDSTVRSVVSDTIKARPAESPVLVFGVPDSANGMLYYASELEDRLKRALPGRSVRLCGSPRECADSAGATGYHWNAALRTLDRGMP